MLGIVPTNNAPNPAAYRSGTNSSGGTIANGTLCYQKADGSFAPASNAALATCAAYFIAVGAVVAGAIGMFQAGGVVSGLSGGVIGDAFLGTAGAIVNAAPTASGSYVVLVGRWLSATELLFNPQPFIGPL